MFKKCLSRTKPSSQYNQNQRKRLEKRITFSLCESVLLKDVSICHVDLSPSTICGEHPTRGESLGQTMHRTRGRRCWGSFRHCKEVIWMEHAMQGKDWGEGTPQVIKGRAETFNYFGINEVCILVQILACVQTLILVL